MHNVLSILSQANFCESLREYHIRLLRVSPNLIEIKLSTSSVLCTKPWKQIILVRPEASDKADDLIIIPTQSHAITVISAALTREPLEPSLSLDKVG